MRTARASRRRRLVATSVAALGVVVLVAARAGMSRPGAGRPGPWPPQHAAPHEPAPAHPASVATGIAPGAPPTAAAVPPLPLREVPDAVARSAAASLLADAGTARRQGDLRTTLALLQAAVARAPAVETHAALGGLYLELGAVRHAETDLRAAVAGDPDNADRWIALANALTLKPDPLAAADALEHARAADPSLRVTRDPGGWLRREPAPMR